MNINPQIQAQITVLLGRKPRGLEAVVVSDSDGNPMVIRVASLVDGKPFPNLFWLIDKALVYRIDGEEATGLIKQFQARVDLDAGLRGTMVADHQAYIELRNSYLSPALRQQLESLRYWELLQRRGIGGIADFSRIRCLHTWYAAHLVVPNTIGTMLDQHWVE